MFALLILTVIAPGLGFILQSDPCGDLITEATVTVLQESFSTDVDTVYFSSYLSYKDSDTIGMIIKRSDSMLPVVIQSRNVTLESRPKQRHSVILIDSWQSITMFEDHIKRNRFDCTGYFLVLLLSDTNCFELISAILQLTADNLLYNVNVLYCHEGIVRMFTYFPYGSKENHEKGIFNWNTFATTGFTTQKQHFSDKFENFHGSAFRVALFNVIPFMILIYDSNKNVIDFKGIDGSLLKTLSHLLNFTVIPVELPATVKWGNLYPNGSATGAMQLLLNGSVNFTLGFFGNNPLRQQYMTGTFSHYQTSLILIISPGAEYGGLEKLFLPFQFSLWACFGIVLMIGTSLIVIIKALPAQVQSFVFGRGNTTPLMNFFQSTIGNPVNPAPKRNFARFILMLWIFATFTLRSAYHQVMFYNFHHIKTHPIPRDYKEFNEANYRIFAVPSELYLFERSLNKHRITTVPIVKNAAMLQAIRYGRVRGARVSYPEFVHYLNEQALVDDKPIYHQFNERLYSYPISIFFRKDSPLAEAFNQEILSLVTHGFIQCWKRERFDRKLATLIRLEQRRARMEPLTARMLGGVFGLYLVGMICAGMVLVGEICVNSFLKQ